MPRLCRGHHTTLFPWAATPQPWPRQRAHQPGPPCRGSAAATTPPSSSMRRCQRHRQSPATGLTMPRLPPRPLHQPCPASASSAAVITASGHRSPVPRAAAPAAAPTINYQLPRPLVLPPSAPLRPQSYTPEPPSRNTKKQKSDERSHLPSLF